MLNLIVHKSSQRLSLVKPSKCELHEFLSRIEGGRYILVRKTNNSYLMVASSRPSLFVDDWVRLIRANSGYTIGQGEIIRILEISELPMICGELKALTKKNELYLYVQES